MSRELRRIALLTAAGYAPGLCPAVGGLFHSSPQLLPDAAIAGCQQRHPQWRAGNH